VNKVGLAGAGKIDAKVPTYDILINDIPMANP
jgi:hypothetical protein